MRVQIDPALCQGHGRCYDLVPDLFGEDGDGYATLTGRTADGSVPAGREDDAQLAADNCPELAIALSGALAGEA
jgi:ferredoxin